MAETFRRMTALLVFTDCLLWRVQYNNQSDAGQKRRA